VGGPAPGAGNFISGNGSNGVDVFGSSKGDLVQGNVIGLDVSGTAAVANAGDGVLIHNSAKVSVVANVISGNTLDGVKIDTSANTQVAGNLIGTDLSGMLPLGNSGNGVEV